MNALRIFTCILFMGLTSSLLFGQNKEAYTKLMDSQVGEWMLDKESLKVEPATDRPVPDMKMVFTKDQDAYKRRVYYKSQEGKWMLQADEILRYDEKNKWLKFSGRDYMSEPYKGQLILMEDGTMHGVEFNANNQKTSETVVDMSSATETRASVKSFIYPKSADEDMQIVTFKSTWIKQ